jgi:hypothetical protein
MNDQQKIDYKWYEFLSDITPLFKLAVALGMVAFTVWIAWRHL